jgi:hypothetical protein
MNRRKKLIWWNYRERADAIAVFGRKVSEEHLFCCPKPEVVSMVFCVSVQAKVGTFPEKLPHHEKVEAILGQIDPPP